MTLINNGSVDAFGETSGAIQRQIGFNVETDKFQFAIILESTIITWWEVGFDKF